MTNESKIDPICGMKGTIPAYGRWFCSPYCVKKYAETNHLAPEQKNLSCSPGTPISAAKNILLGLLWTNVGKRAALWLPVIGVPLAFLFAFLFNRF